MHKTVCRPIEEQCGDKILTRGFQAVACAWICYLVHNVLYATLSYYL